MAKRRKTQRVAKNPDGVKQQKKRGAATEFVTFKKKKRDKRQTDKLIESIDLKKIAKTGKKFKYARITFVGKVGKEFTGRSFSFVDDVNEPKLKKALEHVVQNIFKNNSGYGLKKKQYQWKNNLTGIKIDFE